MEELAQEILPACHIKEREAAKPEASLLRAVERVTGIKSAKRKAYVGGPHVPVESQ